MTGDMHTPGSTDTLTEPCSDGNGRPATAIVRRHHVRHDIEGLRALAVLSVLINHAFPNVLPGGFAGVDIFFVISGYLIGGHLLQDIQAGRLNILGFYAKRARRIFPALALVLICIWGIGWLWLSAPELSALGQQIVASVFFSNNILLWTQSGYFDTAALEKPLLHLWSLGIEEQFYLLVPVMLWLGTKGTAGSIRWVARLGALSLLSTIVLGEFDFAGSFYLLHTRFWELAAGVLLAQAELRMQARERQQAVTQSVRKRDAYEILVFCAVAVFCCVLAFGANDLRWEWNTVVSDGGLVLAIILATGTAWFTNRLLRGDGPTLNAWCAQHGEAAATAGSIGGGVLIAASIAALTPVNWPAVQTILPVLGTVLLIAAGPSTQSNKFLALKPLVIIGGISYPLYLWHWPSIVIYKMLSPGARTVGLLIPLTVSFVLASLTKMFVEDPVRFGRLGGASFRRPPLWPVISGLAFAGILGSLVIAVNHVPSRFPPTLQAVADWSEDDVDAWRIPRCYVAADATNGFSSECTPSKRPGVPLVLLWGDSHAAHLYSGLAAIQSSMALDIAQWTVAGCPPTVIPLGGGSAPCIAKCADAMAKLAKLKPDVVVVAGGWQRYLEVGRPQEEIVAALSVTVLRLKELGIRKIVVFGPGPLWTSSLSVDLFRYMVRTRSDEIPERLGMVPDAIWNLDAAMAAQSAAENVQYVSVLNYFCDKTGCLTVGDRSSSRPDLLFRDRDHLSVSGSKFLVAHSKSQLFGKN
jgi:peptidoglycan/LPS O-acetylase OafA/YrhL